MFKIFDNFLPTELENTLEDLHFGEYFPWYLGVNKDNTADPNSMNRFTCQTTSIVEGPQFVHVFMREGKTNSEYVDVCFDVLQHVAQKLKTNFEVIRIKSNLCHPIGKDNTRAHQTPHVDRDDDHVSMIYYVNDSDGDTYFFHNDNDNLTVYNKVSPVKGRAVIFDGNIYHAGSHPSHNPHRIIINFNLRKTA